MDPLTPCKFSPVAKGWACGRCGYVWRGESAPVRICKPGKSGTERRLLTWNDLETLGPCRHLGPVLRVAGCELCGQKDKTAQIHACQHPEKQGHEVTQDRYKAGQMRTDVCRTCRLFPTTTAPRGILDEHEIPSPVEKADDVTEEAKAKASHSRST